MFYELTIGDKVYNLRLSTRNVVMLEKKIGINPILIFGNGDRIPTITEMVQILEYSLSNNGKMVSENEAYNLFDKWLEDGNAVTDFIPVIVEIYKVSGLIKDEDDSKN